MPLRSAAPLARVSFFSAAWLALVSVGFAEPAPAQKISYHKQIRPIFQANCQGCHQPAKSGGDYVMTRRDSLLKGGESGEAAVVPGHPEKSNLVTLITPQADGSALMPQGRKALTPPDLELISQWIAQGAEDDTPASTAPVIDQEHPPVYHRQPVVSALDYSPDGSLLAISGFHEVLVWKADGSELVARLVGVAERIESIRFSPDGGRLLVTGGSPARMGEIQVWNVAGKKLALSVPVTFDTVYGGSWSPDGKLIAFGCADNSVRAINSETGEQVLFQGAHSDWVRDTVFSKDGSNLVSVGRDMTAKLIEVATQRFVDNVTSITPGALKGGLQGLAKHPERDEIAVGGSDGVVRVYRVFRLTSRVIGDDSNLIREMPPQAGRVFGLAVSRDGKRIAAGSSLDGRGEVVVYSYEFDTNLPDNIKAINSKVNTSRSAEENAALAAYHKDGVRVVARLSVPQSAVYAVAFRPDGKQLAAAGTDGVVRLLDPESGAIQREFPAAPLTVAQAAVASHHQAPAFLLSQLPAPTTETLPPGRTLTALEIQPPAVVIEGRGGAAQLLVTGVLDNGERVDVTRMSRFALAQPLASVSAGGLVQPLLPGETALSVETAGQKLSVPVTVRMDATATPDFVRDVNPVLSKLGCNQGTCHGSAQGKNGFKLSLRGYDPIFDIRALTDDLASRRTNLASAADSLMLLKPIGAAPHQGGQLLQPGEPYYETIRSWIDGGAKLDLSTPRVVKIELQPTNPIVQQIGGKQQMRVIATYADGAQRDVTRDAFIETGNLEVATADRTGLMTTLRRGEAPMLARYEGAYAATTLTVMGDRTGFVWKEPESYNKIDELVARKWERMKIQPSELCSDAEFLRRATLDLTGLPPSADAVRAFLADTRDGRTKRAELVSKLIGSEDYVEYWTNKWADLLQVNRKFLAPEGAAAFRGWIREHVANNTPYDEFAKKIVTASGSNRENPAAAYYKILRTPTDTMENTTHLFLAVRFNCNKCHDHPFERWTQDQYYQMSAWFAQVGLEGDPQSNGRNIGGTAVEGAKPLYEIVKDLPTGEVIHDRTKAVTPPAFPYPAGSAGAQGPTRRAQLAEWIAAPENAYFAKSHVNRLWGYMFGVGIIDPIDDIRAGNPPSNPELLDYLTQEFVASGFNTRHVLQLICTSRTYQLSVDVNPFNSDDKINYSHAAARRLPAEVLYDTVYRAVGATTKLPGVAPGTRAAALPDSGLELPSGFLTTFGRPVRESSCECERSSGLQLGPIMALISGPTVAEAIGAPDNALAKLTQSQPDDRQLVDEVFLRLVGRHATDAEVNASVESMRTIPADHAALQARLAQREAEVAPIRAAAEAERLKQIERAKQQLAAYEAELAPKRAAEEQQRAVQADAAAAQLKELEAAQAGKFAEWEAQQQSGGTKWVVIDPKSMTANTKAALTKQPDGSILAEQKNGPTVYTVVAETDLVGLTGMRLEALTDDRLPSRGPGLPPNGNFVLTELEVQAAPKAKPKDKKKVTLTNGVADFSQDNYDIKTVYDGKKQGNGNGWAVSPQTGQPHWATLEFAEAVGAEGGTVLTFALDQRYGDSLHNLGKFRISVTTSPKPHGVGLPVDVEQVLAVAADQRTEEQKAVLRGFYFGKDEAWKKKSQEIAALRQPLPPDVKQEELKGVLKTAEQPVPEDARLAQYRRDVEMSRQQMGDVRLTMVQDLAWALINSPEFLFNH